MTNHVSPMGSHSEYDTHVRMHEIDVEGGTQPTLVRYANTWKGEIDACSRVSMVMCAVGAAATLAFATAQAVAPSPQLGHVLLPTAIGVTAVSVVGFVAAGIIGKLCQNRTASTSAQVV